MDLITITILILLGIITGIAFSILVLLFIQNKRPIFNSLVGELEKRENKGKAEIVGFSEEEASFQDSLPKDKDYKVE